MSIRRPPEPTPWTEVVATAIAGLALGTIGGCVAGALLVGAFVELMAACTGERYFEGEAGLAAMFYCLLGGLLCGLVGAIWLPSTLLAKADSNRSSRPRIHAPRGSEPRPADQPTRGPHDPLTRPPAP